MRATERATGVSIRLLEERAKPSISRTPQKLPIISPTDTPQVVAAKLHNASPFPKLWFYARPGFAACEQSITDTLARCRALRVVDVSDGVHYLTEDDPDLLVQHLRAFFDDVAADGARWLTRRKAPRGLPRPALSAKVPAWTSRLHRRRIRFCPA
jgi:hypothetical protein